MSRAATQPRDLHAEITARIIAALEAGTKPWKSDWLKNGLPLRSTGEEYRGINTLILTHVATQRGYSSPYWLTFNQARELGACVRKGERASPVVFYKQFEVEDDANDDGKRMARVLRGYSVFNVDQIDGLPTGRFPAPVKHLNPDNRDSVAETALRSCGADIREGGDAAYYDRDADLVRLPDFERFKSAGGYLATMAHELAHWTGAPHRLGRAGGKKFGDTDYAFEELVAEISASFICARLGVAGEHFDSHAAYVANWLQALRNDRRMIFKAAALAQTAADLVLAKAGRGEAPARARSAPPVQAELAFA